MRKCSIKLLFKKIFNYKKELIKGNIFAILATITTVIVPLFIPLLIDELLLHKSNTLTSFVSKYIAPMTLIGYLFFFLVLAIFLRFLGVVFSTNQVRSMLLISKNISLDIRESAINHLKRAQLKEYERFSPGAITSKLVTDIDTIDNFIGVTVGKLIVSVLILLFTSIILILINLKLALFIILTNPIVIFFTAKMARKVGQLKRVQNRAVEEFQEELNDSLELFNQIKAANKEDYFFSRVLKKAKKLKDISIEFSYKSDRAMRLSIFTFLSGYELFRAVSILAVAYSDLSIGLMLAIFGYLWIMMTPTQDIINFQYSLATAKAACKRVEDIFRLSLEREVKNPKNPFNKEVEIRVTNLDFGYEKDKLILKDISLEILPKAKVAIVGPSGSGKSTLANLIAGFYEPDSGDILYNKISYKEILPKDIRQNIYLILQHPKLFNDTLLFNLTLGKNYPKEEIEKAIDLAELRRVVESLKDGLNTIVGKDGVKLSGGERQRVAIARMILSNPKVVIFDESTSALDVHTEERIFSNLKEFLSKRSVITIAHRLSTIESSEYIFVLENGKLSDRGTPKELLKKDAGYFAKMI
ncbi:MAG: ABC transporter ATP-binding protein [Epsilonproteobacteria bacterium]|nr:ABC transporter ATP-binding protein [Campylobacterota bacterium]